MKYCKSMFLFFIIELTILIVSTEIFALEPADNQTIPAGCSDITVVKEGIVFLGGNDDYINPDSYYRVEPGLLNQYGQP